MADTKSNIVIRLSTTGSAEVVAQLEKLGVAGDVALGKLGAGQSAEKAAAGFEAIGVATETAEAGLSRLAGLSGAIGAGGLLAGLGLTEVVSNLRETAEGIANIGETSEKLGVSTAFLQEFQYAAKLSGANVEEANASLQHFASTSSDAARGQGDLAGWLKANGVELKNWNTKSVSDQIAVLFNLIKSAKAPQDALNLASAAFGRSNGPAMVNAARDGAEGFHRMADEAQSLGVVLDDEVIKKARDVVTAFTQAATVITAQFGGAMIEGVETALQYKDAIITLAEAITAFLISSALTPLVGKIAAVAAASVEAAGVFGAMAEAALAAGSAVLEAFGGPLGVAIGAAIFLIGKAVQANYDAERAEDENRKAGDLLAQQMTTLKDKTQGELDVLANSIKAHRDAATAMLQHAQAALTLQQAQVSQDAPEVSTSVPFVPAPGEQDKLLTNARSVQAIMAQIAEQQAAIDTDNKNLAKIAVVEPNAPRDNDSTLKPPVSTARDPAAGAARWQSDLTNEQKNIDLLNAEADAVGKTAAERARAEAVIKLETAAKQANAAAGRTDTSVTAAQEAQIQSYADQVAAATQRLEDAKQAQTELNDRIQFFGDEGLEVFEGLEKGASGLKDSLKNVSSEIADMILKASLLGQGPLAGLFGAAAPSTGGLGGLFGGIASLFTGSLFSTSLPLGQGGIGHNAQGTEDWRGGPTWVGENGPELLDVPQHSEIISNGLAMNEMVNRVNRQVAAASQPASTVNINMPITVNAQGASPDVLPAIKAQIDEFKRSMPSTIVRAVKDAQRRGQLK